VLRHPMLLDSEHRWTLRRLILVLRWNLEIRLVAFEPVRRVLGVSAVVRPQPVVMRLAAA
jgi:hypothetical protein